MNDILNADLHCHSVVSDGTLTPEVLAQRAKANGVELWALTDHDELGGQDRAMAAAREEDGQLRPQPVFCLMRSVMLESLVRFTQGGGRKIDAWTARHKTALVPFDLPDDDPKAFFNANTLAELHQLEKR